MILRSFRSQLLLFSTLFLFLSLGFYLFQQGPENSQLAKENNAFANNPEPLERKEEPESELKGAATLASIVESVSKEQSKIKVLSESENDQQEIEENQEIALLASSEVRRVEVLNKEEKPSLLIPKETAFAYIAKSLNGSDALVHFNENKARPVASLTKLMTSLVALDYFQLEDLITIGQEAIASEGIAGKLGLNESYSLRDLIRVMMTVSSNDAAMAIAEKFGSENFVRFMNNKALELGMYNTSFADPTGLSPQNLSTIQDLELLVKYLHQNHPEILGFSKEGATIITDQSSGQQKIIGTINEFAHRPDFLGGKTGYTEEAGGNLISLFLDGAEPVLVVVLGSQDRFNESQALLKEYKALKRAS